MIQHFESGDRRYEWHPDKARSNLDKHGVDFVSVKDFEWDDRGDTSQRPAWRDTIRGLRIRRKSDAHAGFRIARA